MTQFEFTHHHICICFAFINTFLISRGVVLVVCFDSFPFLLLKRRNEVSVSVSWGQNSTYGTSLPPGPFFISPNRLIVLVAFWSIDFGLFSAHNVVFSFAEVQFFGFPVYCSCTPSGCFCLTVLLLFLQHIFDFMLGTVSPARLRLLYSTKNQVSGLLKSCHVMVSICGVAAFLLLQKFVDFFSPVIWYPFVWSPPTLWWFVSPAMSRASSLFSWRTAKRRRTPYSGVSPLWLLGATWV